LEARRRFGVAVITIEVSDEGAAVVERRIRNAVSGVTITVKSDGPSPSPLDTLSPAEQAVVRLILTGMTSKEIAASLTKAQKTVENQRVRILDKLELPNVVSLVGMAYKAGWA
jgi:DNA-binding NarL/FixJ family response regulator